MTSTNVSENILKAILQERSKTLERFLAQDLTDTEQELLDAFSEFILIYVEAERANVINELEIEALKERLRGCRCDSASGTAEKSN